MQKKVCIDVLYSSLLTSVKSAGRRKQDKGCLEQCELTKALPAECGSTPCFFWSQKDGKNNIPLLFS